MLTGACRSNVTPLLINLVPFASNVVPVESSLSKIVCDPPLKVVGFTVIVIAAPSAGAESNTTLSPVANKSTV